MKNTFKLARIVLILGLLLSACKRQAEAPPSVAAASPTPNTTVEIALGKADQVLIDHTVPEIIEPSMLPGPNAVPADTRIVVNIPAFRMGV